ncbi:unnamed protein product, partial [Mesorhabditis belari]|uniref:KANSL3 helical domain-containing protein n=1 Tax=Mesorhabditis belari TaxID=2138241 RepID=A0AAF3ETM0_9BILA
MDQNLDEEHATQSDISKSGSIEEIGPEDEKTSTSERRTVSRSSTVERLTSGGTAEKDATRRASHASRSNSVISREEPLEDLAPKREVRERKLKREFSPDTSAAYNRRSIHQGATGESSTKDSSGFATPTLPAAERRKSKAAPRYSPHTADQPNSPCFALDGNRAVVNSYSDFLATPTLRNLPSSNFELPSYFSKEVPTRLHGTSSAESYWGKGKPRAKRVKKEPNDEQSQAVRTDPIKEEPKDEQGQSSFITVNDSKVSVPLLEDLVNEASSQSKTSGRRPIKKVGIRLRSLGVQAKKHAKQELASDKEAPFTMKDLPSTYTRRPRNTTAEAQEAQSQQLDAETSEAKCPLLKDIVNDALSMDLGKEMNKTASFSFFTPDEQSNSAQNETLDEASFSLADLLGPAFRKDKVKDQSTADTDVKIKDRNTQQANEVKTVKKRGRPFSKKREPVVETITPDRPEKKSITPEKQESGRRRSERKLIPSSLLRNGDVVVTVPSIINASAPVVNKRQQKEKPVDPKSALGIIRKTAEGQRHKRRSPTPEMSDFMKQLFEKKVEWAKQKMTEEKTMTPEPEPASLEVKPAKLETSRTCDQAKQKDDELTIHEKLLPPEDRTIKNEQKSDDFSEGNVDLAEPKEVVSSPSSIHDDIPSSVDLPTEPHEIAAEHEPIDTDAQAADLQTVKRRGRPSKKRSSVAHSELENLEKSLTVENPPHVTRSKSERMKVNAVESMDVDKSPLSKQDQYITRRRSRRKPVPSSILRNSDVVVNVPLMGTPTHKRQRKEKSINSSPSQKTNEKFRNEQCAPTPEVSTPAKQLLGEESNSVTVGNERTIVVDPEILKAVDLEGPKDKEDIPTVEEVPQDEPVPLVNDELSKHDNENVLVDGNARTLASCSPLRPVRSDEVLIRKPNYNLRNRSQDSMADSDLNQMLPEMKPDEALSVQPRFRILSPKKEKPKTHLPKYVPSIKPLIGSMLLANGHWENLGQSVNQVVNKLLFEVCQDGVVHHNTWLLTKDEIYQRNKERSREARELRKNQPVIHRRQALPQEGLALSRSKREARNRFIGNHEPLHVSISNEDYSSSNRSRESATMANAARGSASLSEFIQAFSHSNTKERMCALASPGTPQSLRYPEIATTSVISGATPPPNGFVDRKFIAITFDEMLYNCGWEKSLIVGPHKGILNGDIFYREMLMDSSYDLNEAPLKEEDRIDIESNDNFLMRESEKQRDQPPIKPGAWEESKMTARKICQLLPRPQHKHDDDASGDGANSWTTDDAIELVRRLEEPQNEDATMEKDSVIVEGTLSDCFQRLIEIVCSQYTLETTCQQDGYENWQSVYYVESQRNAVHYADLMLVFSKERTKQSVSLHRYLLAFLPEHLLVSYLTIMRYSRQLKNRSVDIVNKFIKQTSAETNAQITQKAANDSSVESPKRWIKIGKAVTTCSKIRIKDPNLDELNRTTLSRVLPDVIAICVNPSVYHEQYFDQRNRANEYTYKLISQLCNADFVTVSLDFSALRHHLTIAEAMLTAIEQVSSAVRHAVKDHKNKRIVLFGWGTSTYINHRVVQTTPGVSAIVNFNFPTHSAFGNRGEADDDICLTYCPTLFVAGEDACDFNPHVMHSLRRNMINYSGLIVVGSANEQLCVAPEVLVDRRITQKVVARAVMEHVIEFLNLDVTRKQRTELIPVPLNDIFHIDPDILKANPRPIAARASATYSSSMDEQLPSPALMLPSISETNVSGGAMPPRLPQNEQKPTVLRPTLPPPRQRPVVAMSRPRKRLSEDFGQSEAPVPQQVTSPFSGLMVASRQQASHLSNPIPQRPPQPMIGGSLLPVSIRQLPGPMAPHSQVVGAPLHQRPGPPISVQLVPPHRQLQSNLQAIHRSVRGVIPVGQAEMGLSATERARDRLSTALSNSSSGSQSAVQGKPQNFSSMHLTGAQPTAVRVGPPPAKHQRRDSETKTNEPTTNQVKNYIDPANLTLQ